MSHAPSSLPAEGTFVDCTDRGSRHQKLFRERNTTHCRGVSRSVDEAPAVDLKTISQAEAMSGHISNAREREAARAIERS
jgi:hypothetical protein